MVFIRILAASILSMSSIALHNVEAAAVPPSTNVTGTQNWPMPGDSTDYPTILHLQSYNTNPSIPATDTYRAIIKGIDDITQRMADKRGTWLDFVKDPVLVYEYKTARLELKKPDWAQVWFWLRHSQALDLMEGLLNKVIETGLNEIEFVVNDTRRDWRPNPIAVGSLGKAVDLGSPIASA